MIDRLSMDDIDAGSGIRVMSLAVANEMTEGHSAESGWKEAMKSRNKDFDEVFIWIILQNREFFLIIGNVIK